MLVWVQFFVQNDCRVDTSLVAVFQNVEPSAHAFQICVIEHRPLSASGDLALHFSEVSLNFGRILR